MGLSGHNIVSQGASIFHLPTGRLSNKLHPQSLHELEQVT